MKFVFIVQGEGRGHMTQAIALRNMLVDNGHEVAAVLLGKSSRREAPAFFTEKIKAPVTTFESPNFVLDPKNKGLLIMETLKVNLLQGRKYLGNLKYIDEVVTTHRPDIVINFYDLLAGVYSFFHKDKRGFKYVCVGHQCLLEHPDFEFPEGHGTDRFLLHNNTAISCAKADLLLGLSFVPMRDVPKKHLYVVPPLLRKEVLRLQPEDKGFILTYVVNDGYADDIIAWHSANKHIKLVGFWDRKDAEDGYCPHANLVFHKLNDVKFLEHMRTCTGYASTAGFESICEAMYLGKPVMMVPTGNHFEQMCNAFDAVKAGAGIQHDRFDMSLLANYLPHHKSIRNTYQPWVDSAESKFLQLLSNL